MRPRAVDRETCVNPSLPLLLQYRVEFGLDARLVEVRLEEQCYHEHLPCHAMPLYRNCSCRRCVRRARQERKLTRSKRTAPMVPRTGGMERAWQHSHRVVARHAAAQQ
jgi:hypothetical protein